MFTVRPREAPEWHAGAIEPRASVSRSVIVLELRYGCGGGGVRLSVKGDEKTSLARANMQSWSGLPS